MKKNATILTALMMMIALISNGNNLVEKSPPVKSVLKKVDYGGFLSDSSLSLAYGRQGGTSPFQTDETIIRYDNGFNNDAIGLTSGGTFQVAAYFPATYMVQFAGMKLTKIEYFMHDIPSICILKVYGPGTSTSPGSLLYQQTITPNLYWNNTELSTQVDITGQDLWIGYEVTHFSGEYPPGCDAGPAIAGYGDKICLNGVWSNLSGYGLNYNWNLAGHLDAGSQQTLDADFSADTLTGTAPHTVHFTDLSVGSPTNWQWDFNNDGTIDSEEQNPVWVYNDPGTYTVSLSVSDGTNSNTETKQDYVVVDAPESGIINILPGQRTDGSKILDVEFDLYGNEPEYYVWLDVSFDNGVNFQTVNAVSGDTGWIAPAQNRQITWNAADEFPDGFYSKTMRVKVSADFSIANPPTVTTAAISNITTTTATSGGNVTSDGGASVTTRGVVWSTSTNPTVEQNQGMTNNGEGTGEFVSSLTGLSASTTYFLRSYATNSAGTAYGDELSFTTLSAAFVCGNDFTDARDGKVYGTVQIGTQCWMKQNLNIGTRINGTSNQTNNGTIEKYCYNNSESNCDVYGGLYQWDEMMGYTTMQGVQGICPAGWHLPTDAKWTTLTTYLGGESGAGGKLKETGTFHWSWPNTGATNLSGFSALPGGDRNENGSWDDIGYNGYWWSSSERLSGGLWDRYMCYNHVNVIRDYINKEFGFSVRCILSEGVQVSLPSLTTSTVTNITQTTATSGGNVTSDGGASVTARGVVWSTSANPTIEQNQGMTNDGEGTGEFVSSLTGLSASTTYFLRAYATNSAGTAYGDELSFTTLSAAFVCGNDFTDARDAKVYGTVQIGTQCWMKQNLNIGSRINGTSNQTNNGTIEKYCYNNSESNCDVYGGLYQWDEMMQYSITPGIQGICPTGWHLPTDSDWTTLANILGGEYTAGGKLKEAGFLHWSSPNIGATNSSGFTALPGGIRYTPDYPFYGLNYNNVLWSSTEYATTEACGRYMNHSNADLGWYNYPKLIGVSVRCLNSN